MGKLDGKVTLITGAGSGIGRATALLFAEEGAKVVVADYAAEGGEETVRLIAEAGGQAIFVHVDVTSEEDVRRMVATAVDSYGRIDILHNNAGINSPIAPITEISEEDWDRVLDTDLKGTFFGTKHVVPLMLQQGGGVIVNTASIMGMGAQVYMSPYCAAKAGVILLTRATSAEYFKQNIRANCICPGFIATPMVEAVLGLPGARDVKGDIINLSPAGRLGRPEEVAHCAVFLASDDTSFVNGHALVVDGGMCAGWQIDVEKVLG